MSDFKKQGHSLKRIQAARRYAVRPCIKLAQSLDAGKIECSNPSQWAIDSRATAKRILSGQSDHNFTVWQSMNTFLNKECVAFLPK